MLPDRREIDQERLVRPYPAADTVRIEYRDSWRVRTGIGDDVEIRISVVRSRNLVTWPFVSTHALLILDGFYR